MKNDGEIILFEINCFKLRSFEFEYKVVFSRGFVYYTRLYISKNVNKKDFKTEFRGSVHERIFFALNPFFAPVLLFLL